MSTHFKKLNRLRLDSLNSFIIINIELRATQTVIRITLDIKKDRITRNGWYCMMSLVTLLAVVNNELRSILQIKRQFQHVTTRGKSLLVQEFIITINDLKSH